MLEKHQRNICAGCNKPPCFVMCHCFYNTFIGTLRLSRVARAYTMSNHRFSQSNVLCFLVIAGLLLLQTPIVAQDDTSAALQGIQPIMHFSHLTSDDGLAQNSIETILQDKQGFIWIGTSSGL